MSWERGDIGSGTDHLVQKPDRTYQAFIQELKLFARERSAFESDFPIPDVSPGGHRANPHLPPAPAPAVTSGELMQRLRDWILDAPFDRDKALAFLQCLKRAPDDGAGQRLKQYVTNAEKTEYRLHGQRTKDGLEFWSYDFSAEQRQVLAQAWSYVSRMLESAKIAVQLAQSRPCVYRTLAKYFFLNHEGLPGDAAANIGLGEVQAHYELLIATVSNNPTAIVCSNAKTMRSSAREAAARSHSKDPNGNEIYVYPEFFAAEKKRILADHLAPYRAAVMIHELTHIFCGTKDVRDAYGWESCGNLRGHEQRMNADNLALFAFESNYSMFGGAGERVSSYVAKFIAKKSATQQWVH